MRRSAAAAVLAELRVHQWSKNLLLFVPLTMAHRLGHADDLARVAAGAASFCAAASAGYVINDLADLAHDREHARKSLRPIAAGEISPFAAHALWLLLLGVAVPLGALAGKSFLILLGVYLAISLAYSFFLKRSILLDVIVLAFLYTLRVLAGGVAAQVPVSEWLLMFATFFFLSLALLKRFADTSTSGRPYSASDAAILRAFGVASATLSILVFALYLSSAHVTALYHRPKILWAACPLFFYGLARMWLLAGRGEMHDDPVVFAAKDPATYVAVALIAALLVAAT
jgi:4-hydroxybenzoate polyprenyltransferase